MELYESVKRCLLQHDMVRKGDRVIAGVSGGADSVCLFLLLSKLAEELDFTFKVLHVEHGIRGVSSREDAEFVRRLCEERGVSCRVESVDAPSYAAKHHLSIEEAARDLRYRLFYEERQREISLSEEGRVLVATAHHRDDQAETVLFHLIRGSAIKGLSGMRPVQDGLIRPLLYTGRAEILAFLRQEGASWQEDESNRDTELSRNKLRHEALPVLEEIVNGAGAHIASAAEELSEVHSYLAEETKAAEELVIERGEHILIKKEELLSLHPLLRRYVIYDAIGEACGSKRDITKEHVEAVAKLFEKQSGRQLNLPYDVSAQRTYRGVRLVRLRTGAKRLTSGKTEEEMGKLIRTRIFPAPEEFSVPKKKYTKWFDYDKIKNDLLVRTRRSGDYLQLPEGGRKTLKKYFIDEKIPGEERGFLPLLCDGEHVVWVIGYRVSAYYKVTPETRRIIEVVYLGGLDQ